MKHVSQNKLRNSKSEKNVPDIIKNKFEPPSKLLMTEKDCDEAIADIATNAKVLIKEEDFDKVTAEVKEIPGEKDNIANDRFIKDNTSPEENKKQRRTASWERRGRRRRRKKIIGR